MNDSLAELQATVAALRTQVESLTARLELMEKVVTVEEEENGRVTRYLECEALVVRDVEDPRWFAIQLGTTKGGGAYLQLNYRSEGNRHLAAVNLQVENNDVPHIQLLGKDCKSRADMWLHEDHGMVGVFRPGEVPAAIMKALPTGGSMAVVQANGRPRATMVHNEEAPTAADGTPRSTSIIALLGAEGGPVLKLTEDEGGGLLRMEKDGASATLIVRDETGSLMLEAKDDATSVLLAAAPGIAKVAAQEGPADDEKASAVLSAGAWGGDVSVRESTGVERVNLSATSGMGRVALMRENKEVGASLFDKEGEFSRLDLYDGKPKPGVTLQANEEFTALNLVSPLDKDLRVMAVAGQAPLVALNEDGKTRASMTVGEGCGLISAYGLNGDEGGSAALMGGPLAGFVQIATADGTRLVEIGGTDHGGSVALNNDLGFQRIVMGVKEECAVLNMNHTGNDGVHVKATPKGGMILLCDKNGYISKGLVAEEIEDEE